MNKSLNEEALIKRERLAFVLPYYLTNRSFREEQIDGSQDSVCSWSLVLENQLATLPDLGLFGDTEGLPLDPDASVSFPLCAVKIFSIALPNTYEQNCSYKFMNIMCLRIWMKIFMKRDFALSEKMVKDGQENGSLIRGRWSSKITHSTWTILKYVIVR